jgi:hypothetical protein
MINTGIMAANKFWRQYQLQKKTLQPGGCKVFRLFWKEAKN